MQGLWILTSLEPYIDIPSSWDSWVGLGFLALITGVITYHWGKGDQTGLGKHWRLLVLLLLGAVVSSLSLGIQLQAGEATPAPGLPIEIPPPVVMIFSGIPLVIGAGLIGPIAGLMIGLTTGLVTAIIETHSLFTILEFGLMALLFGAATWQHYRTPFFQVLRHPLAAAAIVSVLMVPAYLASHLFTLNQSFVVRLDYSTLQTWSTFISRLIPMVIAGFVGTYFLLTRKMSWGARGPFIASPGETSLQFRIFSGVVPYIIIVLLVLLVSSWTISGNAARKMVFERLSSTAKVTVENLPFFLETGQSLLQELASEDLLYMPADQVRETLGQRMRVVPYFRQLFLMGEGGKPIAGYPLNAIEQIRPTRDEEAAIRIAFEGVPAQIYTIPPWPEEGSAQLSFVVSIIDSSGKTVGVLLGRADLNSNPFTQPAIKALESLADLEGEGIILDENSRILYHPVKTLIMTEYLGSIPPENTLFEDISFQGKRQLVYYQKVAGRPWSVLLAVPAEIAQQLTMDMAVPMLAVIALLGIMAILSLRISLGRVTNSLTNLANEANIIADGDLEHPFQVSSLDEVGRFGRAFETMRKGLKTRLDELNRLLSVSQGIAGSLDVAASMQFIMQAALIDGAVSARVVLDQSGAGGNADDQPAAYFGYGPQTEQYSTLDRQAFQLTRDQHLLVIPSFRRSHRITIHQLEEFQGAMIAAGIFYEQKYYGTLWVAFPEPRNFSAEEVQFLDTLSGQAALAASSAALYTAAEVGRQRLESVLGSTPEPILVLDEQMRLVFSNPPAMEITGTIKAPEKGDPVHEVIKNRELLQFIRSPLQDDLVSKEIHFTDGRIYQVSLSPVLVDGKPEGRICLLLDISHYEQLNRLKSEFVATVSHYLRAPLSLIHGYASMLAMVGELNEQQDSYVEKILSRTEAMTRLVEELLNLGRIEAGISLDIRQVQPEEILQDVINSFTPLATQKKIGLVLAVAEEQPDGYPPIEVDSTLISQAIHILVENAITYSPMGSQVILSGKVKGEVFTFEVKDFGTGISPVDLEHIFERFFMDGEQAENIQQGKGLGLSIVRSIAVRHKGRVWVESQLGKGSNFYLEVPVRQIT